MGTTRNFGPSEALVAPWIVDGNLTSFLNANNETLGLHDRLLLVSDSRRLPVCTVKLIVSFTSSMALPPALTTVSECIYMAKKNNCFP